jgi:hypothetical protein
MSFPEQAKTTVRAEPPKEADVLKSFERRRTRERNRNINQFRAIYNLSLATPFYTTALSAALSSASFTPVVTPSPPTPPEAPPENKLAIRTLPILVGTKPTKLPIAQRAIRRMTILASPQNAGTIWIVMNPNAPAGSGFPLIAGAAKDFGHPAMNDKQLDPSEIVLIGEDPNDRVYLAYEF